tara:strand:+ start:386 stop:955 length:570 start_codon:yes stop_codon:yes gene_type:complete
MITIKEDFLSSQSVLNSFIHNESNFQNIQIASDLLISCINSGGKIISCGNGGSMCDAMHFSQELSGFFNKKRKALPAICISDPSHITCVANDTSFDFVFSRYIESLGKEKDVLFAISTSGRSQNIINAAKEAKKKSMKVVCLSSLDGADLAEYSDVSICVETNETDRCQEIHSIIIHSIINYIEQKLGL